MSPAKVIHIGADISHRILLLEAAGCRVKECHSLAEAVSALDREGADVIVLTNPEEWDEQRLLRTMRQYTSAPFILFENVPTVKGRQGFDLVIEPLTPPQNWLQRIAAFIESRRTVRIARPQKTSVEQAQDGEAKVDPHASGSRPAGNRSLRHTSDF